MDKEDERVNALIPINRATNELPLSESVPSCVIRATDKLRIKKVRNASYGLRYKNSSARYS